MTNSNTVHNSIHDVTDTALWMATYRAMESEKPNALFRDPLAKVLTGEQGKRVAESMKSAQLYSYWTLVIRTRLIDRLLKTTLESGVRTVINLGAGLDTRPYRLDLPKDTLWIEVDFPNLIKMKTEKLINETPTCRVERIALDLADRTARRQLFTELNERVGPALILTEGVIPYLTEKMVSELAEDLFAQSNCKLWIAEYYSPSIYARFQSPAFSKLLGSAPFRFFPEDWFSVFKDQGWIHSELNFLYDEGELLNHPFPLPWWVNALKRIVGAEKIAERARVTGYVVFFRK